MCEVMGNSFKSNVYQEVPVSCVGMDKLPSVNALFLILLSRLE